MTAVKQIHIFSTGFLIFQLIFFPNFLYSAKQSKYMRSSYKSYQKRKGFRCPKDMVLVYSKKKRVKVCVDKYELSPKVKKLSSAKPYGYQSLFSCMRACRKRGKRILNDREWRIACEGTRPRYCNIYREHPILRKVKSKKTWKRNGKNCKGKKTRWSVACMNDPSIIKMDNGLAKNRRFSKCKSKYGIYNMVGNLGEWVAGIWKNKQGKKVARFNGGLYPQNKSSCSYTTIAHGPKYRDYSIGCRCAMDPF